MKMKSFKKGKLDKPQTYIGAFLAVKVNLLNVTGTTETTALTCFTFWGVKLLLSHAQSRMFTCESIHEHVDT